MHIPRAQLRDRGQARHRWQRFLAVFTAIVVLLTTVAQTQAALANSDEDPKGPSPQDETSEFISENMSYWQSFRERHGFDTAEGLIGDLALQKQGQWAIGEYSVPLTESEEATLLARWKAVDKIEESDDYLRRAYPSFAGVHIRLGEEWSIVVNFASDDMTSARKDVQRILNSSDFELRRVQSSMAELEAGADAVAAMMRDDPSISMVGVDIIENAVSVGIDDGMERGSTMPEAPSAIANFNRHASSELEVPVVTRSQRRVAPETCNNAFDCGFNESNRAGVHLLAENAYQGINGDCTAGFLVDLPNPESPATIIPGILTAGHCSDITGNGALGGDVEIGGQPAKANNHFIHRNTFKNNSRTDLAVVGVDSGDASNHIYKAANKKFRPVTSRKTSGVYTPNDDVCISSPFTGTEFRCGVVEENNVQYPFDTVPGFPIVNLRKLVRMNFEWPGTHYCGTASGAGGASGAPIFLNKKALGIWSGCTGQDVETNEDLTVYKGVFTKIVYAERDLDVTVRTS